MLLITKNNTNCVIQKNCVFYFNKNKMKKREKRRNIFFVFPKPLFFPKFSTLKHLIFNKLPKKPKNRIEKEKKNMEGSFDNEN